MFEEEVANYTGAPYAVAVDNCTDALLLCCLFHGVVEVWIPSRTYLSVPQAIMLAGGKVVFDERLDNWKGIYKLEPYPIYDAAKRFTSAMYQPGSMMCLSFHDKKILKIGKGGMILTDDEDTYKWLKRMRYEGRDERLYQEDDIFLLGYNMYMTPESAARGLTLMRNVPLHNDDLVEGYQYLPDYSLFKGCKVVKRKEGLI